MITDKVLYKHMKNWAEKPKGHRPVIQHIWFDGENAVATNTHILALAKDIHTSRPYFETVDGNDKGIHEDWKFLDYHKVLTQEKDIYGKLTIKPTKNLLQSWVAAGNLIKKMVKGESVLCSYLANNRGNLELYTMGSLGLRSKITLVGAKPTDDKWAACYNSEYLANAFEFLKDTGPVDLAVYVNNYTKVLTFETSDILLLISPCRIRDDQPLYRWVKYGEGLIGSDSDFNFDA